MPVHVQPILRARQEALELDGQIPALDSALVTNFKAQEAQGLKPKVIPLHTLIFRNTVYVPK